MTEKISFLWSHAGGLTDGWTDRSPLRLKEGQTDRRTDGMTKKTIFK